MDGDINTLQDKYKLKQLMIAKMAWQKIQESYTQVRNKDRHKYDSSGNNKFHNRNR
jgi:hypothetical protein